MRLPNKNERGFTLIETLVAISLLAVAIVAPMALVSSSLSAAIYAGDQVTAYYLAQEGIEVIRARRDDAVLGLFPLGKGNSLSAAGIPVDKDFYIDTLSGGTITACTGQCPLLKTDGNFYGYGSGAEWIETRFRRTLTACYIQADQSCGLAVTEEMRLTSTIAWTTPVVGSERSFQISESLFDIWPY